jgi:DNA mismatch repair protein MutL
VNASTTAIDSGIIHVMPDVLANKIAAGEVIQRPGSAVKELVENAIDAGARRIEVVVKDAGRTLIQIVDDGCGMSPLDARTSFERHATSKIRSIEDLERIRTLGFRGEALASLSAISRVELRTRRQADAQGTCVRVEGGENLRSEPCAAPVGTSVSARQLFFNVPARRAFLKTDATELRHVLDAVQFAALAHPEVAFVLVHDDTELLRVESETGPDALASRVRSLSGHDPGRDLVPVDEETSYLRIHGMVGRPAVRRRARGEQFLFVNGRPVRNRYLEHAVFSAYRGLVPEGSYPWFVLFLDIDPRHVDVNVHPAKAEVKFDDERGVYGMLRAVVSRALSEWEGTPSVDAGLRDLLGGPTGQVSEPPTERTPGGSSRPDGWAGRAEAASPGAASELLYGPSTGDARPGPGGSPAAVPSVDDADDPEGTGPEDVRLWQLQDTYVVTPIRSGLMIVDQYAAHERILYERALQALSDGFGLSQQLLFPRTVELSAADFALIGDLLADLRSLGFDLDRLSGRTVLIRGVPADIRTGDERTVLEEVLEQFRENARIERLGRRENLARSIARRSAIRAGTRLDELEMRALIDQLFQCAQPYAGPDGRPTLVRIPVDELDRRFGRRR